MEEEEEGEEEEEEEEEEDPEKGVSRVSVSQPTPASVGARRLQGCHQRESIKAVVRMWFECAEVLNYLPVGPTYEGLELGRPPKKTPDSRRS